MNKILWVIDETLNERQYDCRFPTLAEAAEEAGHRVIKGKYIPFLQETTFDHDMNYNVPIVAHGTIEFIREFRHEHQGACPGFYQNDNVRSFEKFAVPLRDFILNDDYYILPYNEFVKRGIKKPVFIKPLSGLKQFTGKVIAPHEFEHEIRSMNALERVDDDLLCVIASPKFIKAEFRYIIADKKVVTGSEYRWDNILDVRVDTLPECDALANTIANHDWQADFVYVCDIAMTDDGPKVIELNSFSSSGLYACDTRKIVEAVSNVAIKEYDGDF